MPPHSCDYDIIICGGGVAGVHAALTLAHAGYRVLLIEKRKDLLEGTSGKNPGRMGTGFHYRDFETGKLYLESTIDFIKMFRKQGIEPCLGASTLPENHPFRHGRYFITENSQVPAEEMLAIYTELKEHYRMLCKQDPENEVLGNPENFFKILKTEEYENDVTPGKKIMCGIETCEHLLDRDLYLSTLRRSVIEHPKIAVQFETEATGFQYGVDNLSYTVTHRQADGSIRKNTCKHLVNSTWESIAGLNQSLGITPDAESFVTNRMKLLAKVKLPESIKDKHCMFFAMGPFCMFSNMQNGYGYLTYAPVTNHVNSTALELSEEEKRKLYEGLTPAEKEKFGKAIIAGLTEYINGMGDAELVDVEVGIVQTVGEVDIYDPKSAVHQRRERGNKPLAVGAIEIASRKLLYGPKNAEECLKLVRENEILYQLIAEISKFLPASKCPKRHLQKYGEIEFVLQENEDVRNLITQIFESSQTVSKTALPILRSYFVAKASNLESSSHHKVTSPSIH